LKRKPLRAAKVAAQNAHAAPLALSRAFAKDTPTGHFRGIPAVDGYQGPTKFPPALMASATLKRKPLRPRRSPPRTQRPRRLGLGHHLIFSGVPVSCADQFALELSETTD
jgi:hypothetical protein